MTNSKFMLMQRQDRVKFFWFLIVAKSKPSHLKWHVEISLYKTKTKKWFVYNEKVGYRENKTHLSTNKFFKRKKKVTLSNQFSSLSQFISRTKMSL